MNEEAIFAKLFERVSLVTWTRAGDLVENSHSFITKSRRVKLFAEVPGDQQPACFQAEHGSVEAQTTNLPYKTVLEANWIIYQCVGRDPAGLGAVENNLILGGVRRSLAPLPSDQGFMDNRNTLGGLVHHCFIQGRLFKDPGDLDAQGMMVVPIRLLVP